ncbi:haloacid dehalogenase-like hydrolase [Streptomyces malaysiensis]|uniref:phosphoserine phosphatase n=1 Tax=Streptomyces malaysiensis subsp. samsunensis TaxID=459658 RepID=A0A9X2LT73_STRMQ|nr:haloacid dehalogenase-like hydrolase [Streptomyces samsunensis]MCQ8828835.1 haloacid dehalogenase-like hydrolase [Streptomyces samsunensis]
MRTAPLGAALGLASVAALMSLIPASTTYAAETTAERAYCPRLSSSLAWYGDNRERLQRVIDERGTCGNPQARHGERPVAAFDWDNTVSKNDITDLAIAWALEHDKILRPAHWSDTSPWLTEEADRTLTEACGTDVPVGAPLPTSTDTACTDEIFSIRSEATLMNGHKAFAGEWNSRRTLPQYAWVPQLFAGHTEAEVTSYARKSRAEALAAPVGATQRVGSHTLHAYARYNPQIKDLIRVLKKAGFEVWVDSAGSTPVTNAWAGGVGVDREHVLAIRNLLDRHGRITYTQEGCGGEPASKGTVMPYIEGKRCWLNEKAFGVTGPDAWKRQAPQNRPVIAGGDADTDVTMVGDATGAGLVLNRNKNEIMCRAYDNADGTWLINPMFIEPLPRKEAAYPCSTTGYTNPDGTPGPVRRQDRSVIPDQEDSVHGG